MQGRLEGRVRDADILASIPDKFAVVLSGGFLGRSRGCRCGGVAEERNHPNLWPGVEQVSRIWAAFLEAKLSNSVCSHVNKLPFLNETSKVTCK